MAERFFQTGQGRVFLQSFGSGPSHPVDYLGCARLPGFSESLGDLTPVRCPSPDAYDRFDVVDEVRGESSLPTVSLEARFGFINPVFTEDCPFDLQAHYGKCEQPTNFNGGWEKILAFERARFTARSSDDLTALDEGERATILLTGDITARRLLEINRMVLSERAEAVAMREVIAVAICDYVSCGECGWESRGCERIYAITASSGLSSPGLPAELLVSLDGGVNWDQYDITELGLNEDPSDLACMGNYVVVVSQDSGSLHYALNTDLATWYEVAVGFVDSPLAIDVLSATEAWIVGDAGYVYFTDDPTAGVTVQDDGTAAGGNALNDVHAVNSRDVVAVGANQTVVSTSNGGAAWASPAAGPAGNLLCLAMRTDHVWFSGTDNGFLFYTPDAGVNWYQQAFPGQGAGAVRSVAFAVADDAAWGFMAHDDGVNGYMLRSLDGGNSWYLLPDGPTGAIPANERINDLAVCRNPNFVVGGGLADDGVDGIVIIGA